MWKANFKKLIGGCLTEVWFYFLEKVVKFGDHSLKVDTQLFSEGGSRSPPPSHRRNRVKATIDKSKVDPSSRGSHTRTGFSSIKVLRTGDHPLRKVFDRGCGRLSPDCELTLQSFLSILALHFICFVYCFHQLDMQWSNWLFDVWLTSVIHRSILVISILPIPWEMCTCHRDTQRRFPHKYIENTF